MNRVLNLLFLFIPCLLFAQTSENWLSEAASLQEEAPARAAALYDSIRQRGLESPALYLAQGNAYFAADDLGRAVLAYERGLRLRPGQKDLTNNLNFAEESLTTVLSDLPGFFLERWWRWAGSRLGITTARLLAIVFWWVAVVAFGIWFFKRSRLSDRKRFLLLPTAGLALLLAILFLSLGNSRLQELKRTDLAIVVASTAPLRVAPGPDATLEQEVTAGQRLRIVDNFQDRYFKVVLRDGKQGWLDKKALEVI